VGGGRRRRQHHKVGAAAAAARAALPRDRSRRGYLSLQRPPRTAW